MGILKDQIGLFASQKGITNLSADTIGIIAQISDPIMERKIEESGRANEIIGKMERLITLEVKQNTNEMTSGRTM